MVLLSTARSAWLYLSGPIHLVTGRDGGLNASSRRLFSAQFSHSCGDWFERQKIKRLQKLLT